jgi:DNA-binding MurR/RpiR family transcriptional regulator
MTTAQERTDRATSVRDLIAESLAAEELGTRRKPRFTASERRVAHAVLDDPKIVAFGTVAQVAMRSGSSGPTVLRFAAKLGFSGFVDLQAAVQEEIADQLRPATERIRERSTGHVVARALAADLENVRRSLGELDHEEFDAAVDLVVDRRRAVWVLGSDLAGAGPALASALDLLRDRVTLIDGSPVRVSRELVRVQPDDVVIAIDVRRYERWLLDAARRAAARGGVVVALTDGLTSPLANIARHSFVVGARGVGPFDSAVGMLALVHALTAAVANRLRRSATGRLDEIEASWRDGNDLVGE